MGITRPVDKMGRVVIPKEMRDQLDVKNESDKFDISIEGNEIILRKYKPLCIFCNKLDDCVKLDNITICYDCIEKLNQLKEEQIREKEQEENT